MIRNVCHIHTRIDRKQIRLSAKIHKSMDITLCLSLIVFAGAGQEVPRQIDQGTEKRKQQDDHHP
jgi:hypothetical protein